MWGGSDLVILIPVLDRPHRVAPVLESALAATPDAHVLFIASPEEDAEQQAVKDAGADLLIIDRRCEPGDFARKVNAGYRHTAEPLIFMGADDLHFHPGWFEAATSRLSDTVQVVGTNDLGNPRVLRGVHSTHSLVTRAYVDRHGTVDEAGKILHEGYWHEGCDDEFVETSWLRESWAFAGDAHVEHLHPNWSKAPTDASYDEQAVRMRQGRRLFERRRPLWTPNPGP